jgi:hypothetical protein
MAYWMTAAGCIVRRDRFPFRLWRALDGMAWPGSERTKSDRGEVREARMFITLITYHMVRDCQGGVSLFSRGRVQTPGWGGAALPNAWT